MHSVHILYKHIYAQNSYRKVERNSANPFSPFSIKSLFANAIYEIAKRVRLGGSLKTTFIPNEKWIENELRKPCLMRNQCEVSMAAIRRNEIFIIYKPLAYTCIQCLALDSIYIRCNTLPHWKVGHHSDFWWHCTAAAYFTHRRKVQKLSEKNVGGGLCVCLCVTVQNRPPLLFRTTTHLIDWLSMWGKRNDPTALGRQLHIYIYIYINHTCIIIHNCVYMCWIVYILFYLYKVYEDCSYCSRLSFRGVAEINCFPSCDHQGKRILAGLTH